MIEWITLLLDSRVFMRANGILGFLLLGLFILVLCQDLAQVKMRNLSSS